MNIQTIKEAAQGRWEEILLQVCPEIAQAIESKKHTPCPVHGGRHGDGFRVFKNVNETGGSVCNTCGVFPDGIGTIMFVRGCSTKEALAMVQRVLGNQEERRQAVPPSQAWTIKREEADKKMRRELMNAIWRESKPLDPGSDSPAIRYLRSRGLNPEKVLPINSLREHPRLSYWDGGKVVAHYPALIGLIRNPEGKAVTLHRIYITSDGQKAPVKAVKKMMPPVEQLIGSAIRLYEPTEDGHIAIAEGIETAMAYHQLSGIPVWAASNAWLLEHFQPTPEIRKITIVVDNDPPTRIHPKGHGQEVGTELLVKMWKQGIKSGIIIPNNKDILDDLVMGAQPIQYKAQSAVNN